MAGKSVEIRIGLRGATATTTQLKSVEDAFDSFGGGLGGVARGARRLDPRLAVVISALERAAAAAAASTAALVGLGVALDRVGHRGTAVSTVAEAFEQIASPTLLARLNEATSGIVNNLDLMTHAGRALRTGFGTEDEIVGWFETVRLAASATGRDLDRSFERLAGILAGDELALLEDLGVNITNMEEQLEAVGMSAEDASTRITLLRMGISQLDRQFGDAEDVAQTYGLMVSALGTSLRNFADGVARAFSEDPRLREWLQPLTEGLQESLPVAEQWGARLAELAISVGEALIGIAEALIPIGEGFARVTQAGLFLGAAVNPQIRALYEAVELSADALSDLRMRMDAATQGANTAAESSWGLSRAQSDLGGGVRSVGDSIAGLTEAIFGNIHSVRESIRTEDDATQAAHRRRNQVIALEQAIQTGTAAERELAIAQLRAMSASDDLTESTEDLTTATESLFDESVSATRGLNTMNRSIRATGTASRASTGSVDSFVDSLRDIRTEAFRSGQALINLSAVQAMSDEQRREIGEARLRQGLELLGQSRRQREEDAELVELERKRNVLADQDLLEYTNREDARRKAVEERTLAELTAQRQARGGRGDDLEARRLEEQREREEELEDIRRRWRRAEDEWREERRQQEEEDFQIAIQQMQEEEALRINAHELRSTLARLEKEDTEAARQAQIAQFETVVDSARGLAQSTKGLFGEISSAMEAMGVSTEKRKKAEGAFIIAYSSVMAILEVAEAVKDFAKQDYVSGALHLVSMGTYVAAAVAAAAQLGGGSPKAPPAAATFTASDRQQPQAPTEGEGRTIINNYSLGRRRGDLGGELLRAQWESTRANVRDFAPAGVSYG